MKKCKVILNYYKNQCDNCNNCCRTPNCKKECKEFFTFIIKCFVLLTSIMTLAIFLKLYTNLYTEMYINEDTLYIHKGEQNFDTFVHLVFSGVLNSVFIHVLAVSIVLTYINRKIIIWIPTIIGFLTLFALYIYVYNVKYIGFIISKYINPFSINPQCIYNSTIHNYTLVCMTHGFAVPILILSIFLFLILSILGIIECCRYHIKNINQELEKIDV